MYRLHDNITSGNGYKIRLLLSQMDAPCERTEYDIDRAETRTPQFLEDINPNGRIPVLETEDGEFITESNAILMYLAEGTEFLPEGKLERARVLSWMFFEQYSHEPNIATPRYWATHGVEMDQEKKLSLATKMRLGYDAFRVMEKHLAENEYLVEGGYSVADIALYAYTHVADEGGFDLSGFPAVLRWMQRVSEQPGYIPITLE